MEFQSFYIVVISYCIYPFDSWKVHRQNE